MTLFSLSPSTLYFLKGDSIGVGAVPSPFAFPTHTHTHTHTVTSPLMINHHQHHFHITTSSLVVLLVVVIAMRTVVVDGLVDRSLWEWKLSDGRFGTLMMRPSPNHKWGTVCKDGMRGYEMGYQVCRSLLGFDSYLDWIVAPGPPDAPIYLDDASCADKSSFTTCTWSAGDASVLGVGTPGTDCSHAEDVGYICNLPAVDDMNFRLVPLMGLPEGSMTGTVEMQMGGVGRPWFKMLVTDHNLQNDDYGTLLYLCSRIFPGRNFTSSQAQYVPTSVGTPALSSSPLPPFMLVGFYFYFGRNWYAYRVDSGYGVPTIVNLTCEAQIEVQLVGGGNVFEGNAVARLTIAGGLYDPAFTPLCATSSSPSSDRGLAMAVCGTLFGPDFSGSVPDNYPFGTSASTSGLYLYYWGYYNSYTNPATTTISLGDTSPKVSVASPTICTNLLPVQCSNYTGGEYEYNFAYVYTYSNTMAVSMVLRRRGSSDPWSYMPHIRDETTVSVLCDAFGLPYNTPAVVGNSGVTAYIFVRPQCSYVGQDLSSCPMVLDGFTGGQHQINCYAKYTPATTEFDNNTNFEFRFAGSNTTLNYTEGVVQMRGNATSPWRSQCVGSSSSSYDNAFASLLCEYLYPGRSSPMHGVVITVPSSYQHPTVPYGQSAYGPGISFCPTTVNMNTNAQACTFIALVEPCSPIAVRCHFGNASLRLYNPSPSGRAGYLQVSAPSIGWGRVGHMQSHNTDVADRVCSDLGFPSTQGFPVHISGTMTALGPHITDFSSDGSVGTTGTVWDFPYSLFLANINSGYVYISCAEPIDTSKIELRITGGTGPTTGIVEARFNSSDTWGRVCDETSNQYSVGDSACMLLFGARYTWHTTRPPSTWKIPSYTFGDLVNAFSCRDNKNMSTCSMLKVSGGGTCTGIGVECNLEDITAVQLVNGSNPSNGVLQVRYSTSWMTVSNDYFKTDKRLWGAMCSMVGYPTPTPLAYKKTRPRYQLDVNPTWAYLGMASVVSSAACTAALDTGDATNISLACFSRSSSYGNHPKESVGLDCRPTITTSLSIHTTSPTSTHFATLTSTQPITSTYDVTQSTSLTPSYTLGATPTNDVTKSQTLKFHCVNSTWPAVGRACEIVQGGLRDPCEIPQSTTIAFGDWFGDRVHTFEVKLQHPMGVRKQVLQATNTTSYQRILPSYVAVEASGGNVTAFVYAKMNNSTEIGVTLRVEVVRTLGGSETSAGVVASVGLLLSPSADLGLFTCVLPNKGLPSSVRPSPSQMRAVGLYVALGAPLLFDAPRPMTDSGTRKAVSAAASAATVASVAAGPMAADMQALAALGSMRCAPGGGDATGQNKDAVADSMEAMSIVALDGTCKGVLMGNVLALGICAGLHVLVALCVFAVKRVQGHARFPFLQAMALVRLPSLLFVASSALQTGFVVCGYQLMISDADAVLGAMGFVFGVVLLPMVPVVVACTIMSRRRYAIEFPSFTLSPPSLRPKPPVMLEVEVGVPLTKVPPPDNQPRTGLRSKLVALFLPASTLDTNFHPLSVAFSTFASRNRLPHAVWSSLPYLTPLALLPALMAPVVACLPLLVTSAILHLLLAAITLIFRPHAILFSNFMGATALLVNALLVICAAALTHDPSMEVARTVLNSIGGLQMMVSVVRLLHVGVVSAALPVMMTLHMLPRPVRVDPTPATPKRTVVGDVEEEMLNVAERDDNQDQHDEKEVVPLWTVLGPCAPRWPPTWVGQLDETEAANELGIGNNIFQDLLFAPDMNGPRPSGPPLGAYEPRDSISDDDIVERKNTVFEAGPITPTLSSSRSSSLDLESEEGKRIEQLRDPQVNPMALMHSTTVVLSERADKKKLQRRKSMTAAAMASQPAFKRRHANLYYLLQSSDSSSSSILLDDDGHPLPSRRQPTAK